MKNRLNFIKSKILSLSILPICLIALSGFQSMAYAQECITLPNTHSQVCGYNCVSNGVTAKCASKFDQTCAVGPNGQIACGYQCTQTAQGGLKCTHHKDRSCVANKNGHIECAMVCHFHNHHVRCHRIGSNNQSNNNPNTPKAKKMCITNFGSQLCGYHCVKSGANAACAQRPDQSCVASMGTVVCGYHCVKTAFHAACAQRKNEMCLTDMFGDAKCGYNCHISNGQIVCQ